MQTARATTEMKSVITLHFRSKSVAPSISLKMRLITTTPQSIPQKLPPILVGEVEDRGTEEERA